MFFIFKLEKAKYKHQTKTFLQAIYEIFLTYFILVTTILTLNIYENAERELCCYKLFK